MLKAIQAVVDEDNFGPRDATHVACTIEMAPLSQSFHVGVIDEARPILSLRKQGLIEAAKEACLSLRKIQMILIG